MQHHHKHHVPDRKLALGAAFLMLQQATQQPLGTLIFEKFFSSRESEFLRTRSGLDRYLANSKKNYGGRCVELRTGVAAAKSSNILVPSAHSIGELPSQVPGRAIHMR